MNKTIEIVVSPQGQTRVETKGFAGSECQQASEFIERAPGQRIDEQLTADYHQQVATDQVQRHQS